MYSQLAILLVGPACSHLDTYMYIPKDVCVMLVTSITHKLTG